jgi:large subunit ribosomal protein L25
MEIKAQIRDILGKKVKSLRKQGLIPAELYGKNSKNIHLAVQEKDFNKVFRQAGESSIINLIIENQNKKQSIPVLIYDINKDYLNNKITHIDFYEVKMGEKIKTHVPLEFIGESEAIKNYGGILNKSMSEIEIECLPQDLPHNILVDISLIKELNQNIYVKDLNFPKGVKPLVDLNTVVATVIEVSESVEEAPVSVADIKVESEEKKEKRQSEKENIEQS